MFARFGIARRRAMEIMDGINRGGGGYHGLKGVLFCRDCLLVMCCFVLKVSRWKYGYCALSIFFLEFRHQHFIICFSFLISH